MSHANNPAHSARNAEYGGQIHTLDPPSPVAAEPMTTAQLVSRVKRRFPALERLAEHDLTAAVAATVAVLKSDGSQADISHRAPK